MLGLQEITGMFEDSGYKYDVIMQERYSLYDFIGKIARDSRFNKGAIFYIRNGEKNRIAYYNEGHWGPESSTAILRKCEVKKAKVNEHDGEFDFYCFIEFISDSTDSSSLSAGNNSSEQSITNMNDSFFKIDEYIGMDATLAKRYTIKTSNKCTIQQLLDKIKSIGSWTGRFYLFNYSYDALDLIAAYKNDKAVVTKLGEKVIGCELHSIQLHDYEETKDLICIITYDDFTQMTVANNKSNQIISSMNLFSDNAEKLQDDSEDTLAKPEWQLDRKALDFIHDAETTGSYLKQIDMIDTVDSLEFSKAIMKRLFQKLNRLRGHK